MIFTWYNLFNASELLATGLPSRSLDLNLTGIGLKTFLITFGNVLGVTVDDKFLAFDIYGSKVFSVTSEDGTAAIYRDENNEVWYGVPA